MVAQSTNIKVTWDGLSLEHPEYGSARLNIRGNHLMLKTGANGYLFIMRGIKWIEFDKVGKHQLSYRIQHHVLKPEFCGMIAYDGK